MKIRILVLFIVGLIHTSFAQEVPTPVKAELVSDVSRVKPGDSFNLGVLMEIDPGWHVYWKNPGDSGLPTKLEFNFPQGFESSAINWPIPSSFKNLESGVDFGYENSLLLWSNVEVSEDAKLNSNSKIEAEIFWISCKEICIPGNAAFTYDLNSGEKKKPSVSLFSKWNKLLPIDIEHSDNPFEIEISSKKLASNAYNIELELKTRSKQDSFQNVEYYPNLVEGFFIENLSYQRLPNESAVKISFDLDTKEGTSLSGVELDGLIVYTDPDGGRSAIEVKINLNDI